jgi:hypothetical protein
MPDKCKEIFDNVKPATFIHNQMDCIGAHAPTGTAFFRVTRAALAPIT